jgi:hypothetical protein
LQQLLTGIGICERALWESLAARDQLWRDVPTTPTGVAKVGARGGQPAVARLHDCARRRARGGDTSYTCVGLHACMAVLHACV